MSYDVNVSMVNSNKKIVIFDTSCLNQMADDSTNAIAQSIGVGYNVRLTGTSFAEVSATRNPERRQHLITVMRYLLAGGISIFPYQWIMSLNAQSFLNNPDNFDWRKLNLRFLAAEREIAQQDFLDDRASEQIRNENKSRAEEFEVIHRNERSDFEKFFAQTGDERPSFAKHCQIALQEGGPGWQLAATLFEKASDVEVEESKLRAFTNCCPPVRTVLVALLWALHRKSIVDNRGKSGGDAGRLDLMSAAYLPYCHIFVTDDRGQHLALTEIANESHLGTNIETYENFLQARLGLTSG